MSVCTCVSWLPTVGHQVVLIQYPCFVVCGFENCRSSHRRFACGNYGEVFACDTEKDLHCVGALCMAGFERRTSGSQRGKMTEMVGDSWETRPDSRRTNSYAVTDMGDVPGIAREDQTVCGDGLYGGEGEVRRAEVCLWFGTAAGWQQTRTTSATLP